MKLLILNGPNLNLLGLREPSVYGDQDYAALEAHIDRVCRENHVQYELRQSNHEGDLVDWIQGARGRFDGIILNPAAYTHTSIAILDALRAVALPAVEVHLTEPMEREAFRRVSYAGMACRARFAGQGFESYTLAIRYFVSKA